RPVGAAHDDDARVGVAVDRLPHRRELRVSLGVDRVELAGSPERDPQDPLLGPVELEARKLAVHVADPIVLVERDGRVGVVLMNRPKQLNALSAELMGALVDSLAGLDEDDDVRAIVLGGRERAFTAAAEIADRGPVALRLATEAVDQAFEAPLQAGVEFERRAFFLARSSEDADEGLRAFLEKRKPEFRGR